MTFQCEPKSRVILRIDECNIPMVYKDIPFLKITNSSNEIMENTSKCFQSPLTSVYNYMNITSYIPDSSYYECADQDSINCKSRFKLQLECFGS